MSDVNMPKLSDTMEEGTVLEWKKQDGDEVHRGEVLAEIESDKASFEIEAEADGVLHIVVAQGQAAPVGEMIGRIGGEAPAAQRPAAAPVAAGGRPAEMVEPTGMEATIGRRMAESKTTVPPFYVTIEARVDEAVRVRQQLKDLVPGADRVTMTDLLTRACAIALTRFPEVNSSWVDGHFERKHSVSIGLAVPPAKGLGLLVPVVHDVDRKDLVQISIEARQVIERARSGQT